MSSPTPNADIISTLPDPILHHILSFLPTKQSAATSILSKKWNQLWLSVLTLDFDDQGFEISPLFDILSTMLMRDTSLPIRSFRLKCGFLHGCDPYDINRFICVAAKRGINNLTLDLSGTNDDFQIRLDPIISTVFNCRNLVALKLKSLRVNVCPQFDFPQLKTLHLDNVSFLGLSGSRKLTEPEACPILEQFQVSNLRFGSPNLNNGRSRSEQQSFRLAICSISGKNPFAWVCSALFIRSELQVDAFNNLTHIGLIFKQLCLSKGKYLVELLQHCPKLQDLTLHKLYEPERDERDWDEPHIIPKCLSSQLRTCSLKGYKGKKWELQFAAYIFKNAKVLQTMKISSSSEDLNMKHQMLTELSLSKGLYYM